MSYGEDNMTENETIFDLMDDSADIMGEAEFEARMEYYDDLALERQEQADFAQDEDNFNYIDDADYSDPIPEGCDLGE